MACEGNLQKVLEFDGSLEDRFITIKYLADYKEECWNHFCKNKPECAVTFNKKAITCNHLTYKLSTSQLIIWNPEGFLKKDKTGFVTLISIAAPLPKPTILWMFDEEHKGKNLGSAGSALDMPVKGLKWTREGPPGTDSGRKYAVNSPPFNNSNHNFIKLKQNGKRLLSFTSGFTVALWVKTDSNREMIIFDEDVNLKEVDDYDYEQETEQGIDFSICGGDQVTMAPKGEDNIVYTIKNRTDVDKWRHVTVIQSGKKMPKYYLNGYSWPLPYDYGEEWPIVNPKALTMWTSSYLDSPHSFAGSIACFMIFEKSLSPAQIRRLKGLCG